LSATCRRIPGHLVTCAHQHSRRGSILQGDVNIFALKINSYGEKVEEELDVGELVSRYSVQVAANLSALFLASLLISSNIGQKNKRIAFV